MAEYDMNLYDVEEVPGNDDLVAGAGSVCAAVPVVQGEYARGDVLMSNADGEFVPATLAGLAAAKEVCLMGRTFTAGLDGTNAVCFFTGRFRMRAVRIGGSVMSGLSGSEQSQVVAYLRQHKIFLV